METGEIAVKPAVLCWWTWTAPWCWPPWQNRRQAGPGLTSADRDYLERPTPGRIPGSFSSAKPPSEFETLTSRLIDRPIRPLFPDFFNGAGRHPSRVPEPELKGDIPALIASSTALAIRHPVNGPIGAAR
jgi:polyribonucleotide nucleotidyltransferase